MEFKDPELAAFVQLYRPSNQGDLSGPLSSADPTAVLSSFAFIPLVGGPVTHQTPPSRGFQLGDGDSLFHGKPLQGLPTSCTLFPLQPWLPHKPGWAMTCLWRVVGTPVASPPSLLPLQGRVLPLREGRGWRVLPPGSLTLGWFSRRPWR